jgi:hypothetical protein
MAETTGDRPSQFGSSFKPEDHDGPEAGQQSTKMEQGVWDTEDGLLGSPGNDSSDTTVAARKGPGGAPQIGRNAPDE